FETRTLSVPRDFVDGVSIPKKSHRTFQEILAEEAGIDFPENTAAIYDPSRGEIMIRHQKTVCDEIEVWLEKVSNALGGTDKQIQFRVEIYEVDALTGLAILHSTDGKNDHTSAWESVQDLLKERKASPVHSLQLFGRSGGRGKAEDKIEHVYPTEFEWDASGDVVIGVANETRYVGTIIEIDPVLGADDYTIDLNFSLEHHTAPPIQRAIEVKSVKPGDGKEFAGGMPEFHAKRIITGVVTHDGGTLLVGNWTPTGKPEYAAGDRMQIVFLRTSVNRVPATVKTNQ
ncbi:MAG: hypothetical protein HKN23_02315, partial [Verrucomicrobiales bacterium]|nr:hypothetical protein [Verrucomicrobiales bacterium]